MKLLTTVLVSGLLSLTPVQSEADPTPATCQLNSIAGSSCMVDFSTEGDIGKVDFLMQGATLYFSGVLEENDRLAVQIIGINANRYAADSGTCTVARGHVLCAARTGSTSVTVEATR